MSYLLVIRDQWAVVRYLIKWVALMLPLGLIVGSACALFLTALDRVTQWRFDQPALLYGLPFAGLLVGGLYARFGQSVEAGNNLIVDEIHEPGGGVPLRMAPLILLGTLVTHLCGGSAGREGTAVQMGGSLASGLLRLWPGLSRRDAQTVLTAGIAAGFGGVFGTPIAGMIFAIEVLAIGRMNYAAIVPSLVASLISHQTCVAWGIPHTHYHIASRLPAGSPEHLAPFEPWLLCGVLGVGIASGLCSAFFAELAHGLKGLFQRIVPSPWLKPVVGGVLVIALTWGLGTRDYLGLGVTGADPQAVSIVSCFHAGGAHPFSWWWKIVFTTITLSSGFKGGEVTPLFFIGAALGNSLAVSWGMPVDLFAALGFVAVFAGATNTPLACTVMAVELFGGEFIAYFAIASLLAYMFSGHSGIYLSQRIGSPKRGDSETAPHPTLRHARAEKN